MENTKQNFQYHPDNWSELKFTNQIEPTTNLNNFRKISSEGSCSLKSHELKIELTKEFKDLLYPFVESIIEDIVDTKTNEVFEKSIQNQQLIGVEVYNNIKTIFEQQENEEERVDLIVEDIMKKLNDKNTKILELKKQLDVSNDNSKQLNQSVNSLFDLVGDLMYKVGRQEDMIKDINVLCTNKDNKIKELEMKIQELSTNIANIKETNTEQTQSDSIKIEQTEPYFNLHILQHMAPQITTAAEKFVGQIVNDIMNNLSNTMQNTIPSITNFVSDNAIISTESVQSTEPTESTQSAVTTSEPEIECIKTFVQPTVPQLALQPTTQATQLTQSFPTSLPFDVNTNNTQSKVPFGMKKKPPSEYTLVKPSTMSEDSMFLQRLERACTQNLSTELVYITNNSIIFQIVGTSGNIYVVNPTDNPSCSCLDHEKNGHKCKHILYILHKLLKFDNINMRTFDYNEVRTAINDTRLGKKVMVITNGCAK